MNVDIKPIHYHKTISEDNINHKVILDKEEIGYNIYIFKTFWECKSEDEVRLRLIEELKILRKQLETEINERYRIGGNNENTRKFIKS